MNKKAQVALFIILGIIIIILGSLFFIFKNQIFRQTTPDYADSVFLFVKDCAERLTPYAVDEIGSSGGYFLSPVLSTESGIPYYYQNKNILIPTKEKIESELSNYLEFMLPLCTNNFENFTDLNISEEEVKVSSKINSESIIFSVEYPINISKGKNNAFIKDFGEFEIKTRFNEIYELSKEITHDFRDSQNLCLSCLTETALNKNLKIEIEQPYNSTLIFIIKDEEIKLNEFPFEFKFAIQNE